MRALSEIDVESEFHHWGGDQMASVGGNSYRHIKELAFMGFWEVAKNIRTILGLMKACKADISRIQPDALILIDYPGFNIRMAEWAYKRGLKVYYYISPQVWAWKENRVHKLKRYVDHMYVILPFEKPYYEKFDMNVSYFGHPLLEDINEYRSSHPGIERRMHGIFPGSRSQEITKLLPVMIKAAQLLDQKHFVISKAPHIDVSLYEEIIPTDGDTMFELSTASTYELFHQCHAAMVASGTATLECALFHVPQVVCYIGSYLSYWIAKRLVNIKYIALANLILDRPAIIELIQYECTPARIASSYNDILGNRRDTLLHDYKELSEVLDQSGDKGVAHTIARDIYQKIGSS